MKIKSLLVFSSLLAGRPWGSLRSPFQTSKLGFASLLVFSSLDVADTGAELEKNKEQKKGSRSSPFFFCGLADFKATAFLDEAVELSDIILFKRILYLGILLLSCAFADMTGVLAF